MKSMPTVAIAVAAVAVGAIATVAGFAVGTGDDDGPVTVVTTPAAAPGAAGAGVGPARPIDADDVPLGDAEARRLERAALRIAGGGTVSEISRSDDPGEAYEVEVLTDRGELDIGLDENLRRVENTPYDE